MKVGMVSLNKINYVNLYSYWKSRLEKLWQIYGHSPNSPMFPPTKVSLHTVVYVNTAIRYYIVSCIPPYLALFVGPHLNCTKVSAAQFKSFSC